MKSINYKVTWLENGEWHTNICNRDDGNYVTMEGRILDATLIYKVEDYE